MEEKLLVARYGTNKSHFAEHGWIVGLFQLIRELALERSYERFTYLNRYHQLEYSTAGMWG
ncbi:hypothetical protein G9P44_006237 [Scheffersomyces stipitis]|nr:hypothetical protein G9P44_006237 [Scheffersomyces stipitis]